MDLYSSLINLSKQMKAADLTIEAQVIDKIADNVESERPLLDAKPTGQPGTWTKPSGEVIKTSKEPVSSPNTPLGEQTVNPNPQMVSQGLAPDSAVGAI